METKVKIKYYLWLVLICLVAVCILVVSPLVLTKNMNEQSIEMLGNISQKNAENVGFRFQEQATFLYVLANRVDVNKIENPQEALESIGDTSPLFDYKRYGIASLDGTVYTSDGISTTLPIDNYVDECVKSEKLCVYKLTKEQSIDGDEVFIMIMPLWRNAKIEAVIYAAFTIKEFQNNITIDAAFDNSEVFFVIDNEGNNIINTVDNAYYSNLEKPFESVPQTEKYKGSRTEQLTKDMALEKSGVFTPSDEYPLYISYAPIGFNGWYLLSIVPSENVDSQRNTALWYLIVVCVTLTVAFSILIIFVISVERRKNKELDKMLYVDSLTEGSSYAKFVVDVKKQLIKKDSAAYIVMDLDNFKLINDYYGYEYGNKTIKHIYDLWTSLLKDNECVGRIAADRFAVFMRYKDKQEIITRLQEFCNKCTLQNLNHNNSDEHYLLVPSIGVYYIDVLKNTQIQSMQNKAVIAKSTVKGNHETMISVYNSQMRKDITQHKLLADELSLAIERNELFVMFQPQFSTDTEKICGAEALIRWKKTDGTFVSPAEFIPLAEERGFVKELDFFVFKEACKYQLEMEKMGLAPIDISVNVSQQSLYASDFAEKYTSAIKESGADISHLQLEITESTLFKNNKMFVKLLRKLHKIGFKILMDDFGTGYSSIMLLKSMPIDYLKLDKSFIDDYDNWRGRSIIECVTTMAQKLKFTIIAEGVETKEQYEYISSQGCHIVQGYYFSKPISFNELCDKIKENEDD